MQNGSNLNASQSTSEKDLNNNNNNTATMPNATSTTTTPAPSTSTSTSTPTPTPTQNTCCRGRRFRKVGNPFPIKNPLEKRMERAARVISEYLPTSQEQALIPESVIQNCKGLVFLSMIKGAYIWSGRIGAGLVITKLSDGRWSAPSAISCLGVGYGAQAGLEFTDVVMILKDDNAVNAFMQLGNITFGANLSLALGPFGRSGEFGWAATCALTYAFSKTRGLFGGLSLEGTVFFENRRTNEKFYGKGASAREILNGFVFNPQVSVLHNALDARFPSAKLAPYQPIPNGNNNNNGVVYSNGNNASSSYQPIPNNNNNNGVAYSNGNNSSPTPSYQSGNGVSYPNIANQTDALPSYQAQNVTNNNNGTNSDLYPSSNNEKERLLNQ